MKTGTLRLKPSDVTSPAMRRLRDDLRSGRGRVGAAKLPPSLAKALAFVVGELSEGRAVILAREDAHCTSQDAADYLGMSRQHLVNLLEEGQLPYHKNGTHRRLRMSEVKAFAKRRDKERRRRLGGLFKGLKKAGLYH